MPAAPTATQPPPAAERPHPRPARCPTSAPPGCRTASGRIVYVERVDPDGDGDAHFVLLSKDSITAPGISVIDVARDCGRDLCPLRAIGSAPQGRFTRVVMANGRSKP